MRLIKKNETQAHEKRYSRKITADVHQFGPKTARTIHATANTLYRNQPSKNSTRLLIMRTIIDKYYNSSSTGTRRVCRLYI